MPHAPWYIVMAYWLSRTLIYFLLNSELARVGRLWDKWDHNEEEIKNNDIQYNDMESVLSNGAFSSQLVLE